MESCVCAPSSSARRPIASASACFSCSPPGPTIVSRLASSSPAIRSRSVVTLWSRCSRDRAAASALTARSSNSRSCPIGWSRIGPLRRLQLVEGGAVLVLQERQPLLGLLCAALGAPASLRLFLHPRLWRFDPSRRHARLTPGDHRNAHPLGLRGIPRVRSEHRRAGGEQHEGECSRQEEHVGSPWPGGAGDVVRRARHLDRGDVADAGREPKADQHGKGVVDESGLRVPVERAPDALALAGEPLADIAVLRREHDLAGRGEQRDGLEVAGIDDHVVDRSRQLADPFL